MVHVAAHRQAPSSSPVYRSPGGTTLRVLLDQTTLKGAEVEVGELTFLPNTDSGDHQHGVTETFYVLDGELEHVVNGQSLKLLPGMIGTVRPSDKVRHKTGPAGARALVIWAPGGEIARVTARWHASEHSSAPSVVPQKSAMATHHATGTFEVKTNPQAPDDKAAGSTLGRLSLDKQFHGDLRATGRGQMLTALTDVKGSAGYVAIERVTGTLDGRSGSFALQHSGTMTSGRQELTIAVVPDSGTDQLVGLAGKMAIQIADGKHSYDFEYTLPGRP